MSRTPPRLGAAPAVDPGFEGVLREAARDRSRPWRVAAFAAMALVALLAFAFACLGWRAAAWGVVIAVAALLWGPLVALRGGAGLLLDAAWPALRWRTLVLAAAALVYPAALIGLVELGERVQRLLGE